MAKKSTPSVAYFEEVDDDGHLIPGAEPKYARSTAPSSPSKEKPNTGRSRKDSSRRERSPSPSFSESDSTEPPHVPKRDSRTNKMKGSKKRDPLVKQQRPPARSHKTAPSAPSRISDESSYYGIHPHQNMAASRPRARTRPESYYGQRPPLSTSAYAHQPPLPPASASVIAPSFVPPPWMGGPPPPPMAMAHALVHQPIPSPTYSEMNPPSRDLASRFRRPQSAMGFQPPLPPPDYEPVKEKALTRRTSVSRKASKNHDERDRIPPPARPASTQPPRERLVFRPTPTHTVTRRKSVGFEDDDLTDADPAMYKAVARREVEYGSGALPSLPRHRRQSFDAESVFDVDTAYDLETVSRGRRNSFYNFEDKIRDASRYQEDVSGGGGPPLTAEALRRVKNDGSSRSTRSSASRDESDYKQSATTRTTRSNNGDDDITIKLPIGAVIEVGNTKIHCKDGGDINIGRGNGTSRAGGSDPPASTYGDDRKSRADRSVARTRASSQAGSYSRTRHAPPLYAPPSSYHYDDYYGPQYSAPYLGYHHDDDDDDSEYSS